MTQEALKLGAWVKGIRFIVAKRRQNPFDGDDFH
jgi:hypothetical protein